MAVVTTNLGTITAYGDAVAAGYTGTKAEWQALMASYATVAETAQGYASDAQGYAEDAQGYANNASTYAGNASSSATTANNAKTAAETAQGYAEDAQEAAESARDAVQSSATQIATNTANISQLSADITANAYYTNSNAKLLIDTINNLSDKVNYTVSKTGTSQAGYAWGVIFKKAADAFAVTPSFNSDTTGVWTRYTNGLGTVFASGDDYTIVDRGYFVGGEEIVIPNTQLGEFILFETDNGVMINIANMNSTPSDISNTYTKLIGHRSINDSITVLDYWQIAGSYTVYSVKSSKAMVNQWDGKSCVCIGDSIMWYDGRTLAGTDETAVGYPTYMRNILGLTVNNQGVSGACVAYHEERVYVDNVTTVDNVDFTLYDLVVLEGGINDYIVGSPIGSMADSNFDKTTFCGAYQYIIEKILTQNPTIQLVIFMPYKIDWHNTQTTIPISDYIDAIGAISERYSIPLIDLYHESGLNSLNIASEYTIDGLHANNAGYKRVNDILINKLWSLGKISQ